MRSALEAQLRLRIAGAVGSEIGSYARANEFANIEGTRWRLR
jgi:hypothetical protein